MAASLAAKRLAAEYQAAHIEAVNKLTVVVGLPRAERRPCEVSNAAKAERDALRDRNVAEKFLSLL